MVKKIIFSSLYYYRDIMIYKRKILAELIKRLPEKEYMLLLGQRQIGKTTLLKQLQQEIGTYSIFISCEDFEIRDAMNISPKNLSTFIHNKHDNQKVYVFIDEIQLLEDPTNFLKYRYDSAHESIKIIATGSSSFYIDNKFKDSLVGRKVLFEIKWLDFEEFLLFKDKVSILSQIDILPSEYNALLDEYIVYGGMPDIILTKDIHMKIAKLRDYITTFLKKDIYENHIENEKKFYQFIKICASQLWGLMNKSDIWKVLQASAPTVDKYLYILEKTFHLILSRPYRTNIRKEISKMPKAYFHDLGLRNAFINDFRPLSDRQDKWDYFENIIFREFYIQAQQCDEVKYRRTISWNEMDIIYNKKWYEVKYDTSLINRKKYISFTEQTGMEFEFITSSNRIDHFYLSPH